MKKFNESNEIKKPNESNENEKPLSVSEMII